MRGFALVVCLWCSFATSVAMAQAPASSQPSQVAPVAPATGPHRVNGTILSFDGSQLTIRTETGNTVVASVLPTSVVLFNERRKMSDIHAGDFVGSAAVTGFDGKLHAQNVRIFPDALRGVGEGQYPMDDNNSNRSMTNATVSEVTAVSATAGTLRVKFHGAAPADSAVCNGHAARDGGGCLGESEIAVAPGVPILAYVLGDTKALVTGAGVSALFAPGPDGAWTAPRVLVEHNGMKPV